MQISRYFFIIGVFLLSFSLFTGTLTVKLVAQAAAETTPAAPAEEDVTSPADAAVPAPVESPAVVEEGTTGTTEAVESTSAAPADLEATIQKKSEEAKTLLKQAEDFYNAGEYDKGYEYAEKAKVISNEINQLKLQLAQSKEAGTKIEEAKTLIGQAENQEADKFASQELANAKTALLSAQNANDKNEFGSAVTFADESINNAKLCLSKIDEQKKALEQQKLGNKEVPTKSDATAQQTGTPSKLFGTGDYQIRTTYQVRLIPQRRDCLWRIAEYSFVYNNPWKWPIIFKANKNQIKNPDLIFPGQNFDIPELDENGNPILINKSATGATSTEKNVPIEVKEKTE